MPKHITCPATLGRITSLSCRDHLIDGILPAIVVARRHGGGGAAIVEGAVDGAHVVDALQNVDLPARGPAAIHSRTTAVLWALLRQHPKCWPDALSACMRKPHIGASLPKWMCRVSAQPKICLLSRPHKKHDYCSHAQQCLV